MLLILFSALGAFLNLVPFCFYDLTENKHRAYVGALKIRAMLENCFLGVLEDEELEQARADYANGKHYLYENALVGVR